MKRFVVALACVVGLAPAVASAAISLDFGPAKSFAAGAIPAGEQFFDVTFLGDTIEGRPKSDEALFAYDLLLQAPQKINLTRAEKPDNWVFTRGDAIFAQAEADPRHILVNAINSLDPTAPPGSDITNGLKAARLFFTIDPDIAPGIYRITLDPNTTTFGSGDPEQELVIPVDIGRVGEIIITPEPSGLAVLAVAGLFALRRRRKSE